MGIECKLHIEILEKSEVQIRLPPIIGQNIISFSAQTGPWENFSLRNSLFKLIIF